jgi:hypothetical protein
MSDEKRRERNRRYYQKHKGNYTYNPNSSTKRNIELRERIQAEQEQLINEDMGIRGGENRQGWVSLCPYCGTPLDKGQCPNKCCGF